MQIYNYVSPENLEAIHEAGLTILETLGIMVEDPELRKTLASRGCVESGDRIKFGRKAIEEMIAAKKPLLALRAINGGADLVLGDGSVKAHSTGGIPWVIDLKSGESRNATRQDLIDSMLLMNQLPNIDIPCSLVYPDDTPKEISQVVQTAAMLEHTRKPIYGPGISTPVEGKYVTELFALYSGGRMAESPIGTVGVSPESPLKFPKVITDTLRYLIKGGVPVSLLVAPVGGFSSAISMAGAMAQLHAETLSFAYVAYIFNPQTPVLYGARQFFANMKNGQAITGLPEVGMASAVAAQLARRCNMVSDLYGLCCSSGCFDSQSGYEKAINALLPAIAGGDLISGPGSLGSLMVTSMAQLLIDNEILGMIKRIQRGFEVTPDTLALEVLEKSLGGRNIIEQPHTLKQLRAGAVYQPKLGFVSAWNDWLKDPKEIGQTATETALSLLATSDPVTVDEKLKAETERIIKAAEKEAGISG